MSIQKTLLTADEFLRQYGHLDEHYALVKGEVVEEGIVGDLHGSITSNIMVPLHLFAQEHKLGIARPSVGFILETNPDTVRGPDVSFTTWDRLPKDRDRQGYIPGSPNLAVEIVNFNETFVETEAKVRDYLRTGVHKVWVIYPISRRVIIHYPDGATVTYTGDDVIIDEELLPGFSLPLAEIFK